jgi:hypothetical protein
MLKKLLNKLFIFLAVFLVVIISMIAGFNLLWLLAAGFAMLSHSVRLIVSVIMLAGGISGLICLEMGFLDP